MQAILYRIESMSSHYFKCIVPLSYIEAFNNYCLYTYHSLHPSNCLPSLSGQKRRKAEKNDVKLQKSAKYQRKNSYVAKNGMQDENGIQTWSSVSSINVNSV